MGDFGFLSHWYVGNNNAGYPWITESDAFHKTTTSPKNIEAKRGRYSRKNKKSKKLKKQASALEFVIDYNSLTQNT